MISHLRIGSRGSDLALWQANYVRDLLLNQHPALTIEIQVITTSGDRDQAASLAVLGGKGAFTKEIEQALIAGTIDLAVHSLKDLPTDMPHGLQIAAYPERAAVEDVLLSAKPGVTLDEMPVGARIATGSIRRRAQLCAKRPDFVLEDVRGNLPTRIEKLRSQKWDGMILARAGIERLGLNELAQQIIPVDWMMPAVGQGALAIQIRESDVATAEVVAHLDHASTRYAVSAERAFLTALGGGCQMPIGAHVAILGNALHLEGRILSIDGGKIVEDSISGDVELADELGHRLADSMLAAGGGKILRAIYSASPAQ